MEADLKGADMSAAPAGEHNPTVLVFDDEDDLRQVMCRMLQRRGFTTLSAGSPDEAVAICQAHAGEIALLLADLGMPEAIGVQLARQATALRPRLRVLYISGLPKEAAVRQGLLGDDATVVQKPFTTDSLVGAVREMLGVRAHSGAT
jgi:CheY-like chemotaxis protein